MRKETEKSLRERLKKALDALDRLHIACETSWDESVMSWYRKDPTATEARDKALECLFQNKREERQGSLGAMSGDSEPIIIMTAGGHSEYRSHPDLDAAYYGDNPRQKMVELDDPLPEIPLDYYYPTYQHTPLRKSGEGAVAKGYWVWRRTLVGYIGQETGVMLAPEWREILEA